jgi:hypothetical protein
MRRKMVFLDAVAMFEERQEALSLAPCSRLKGFPTGEPQAPAGNRGGRGVGTHDQCLVSSHPSKRLVAVVNGEQKQIGR